MPEIKAVYFDVGGVMATNGWDHNSRKLAAGTFAIDYEQFEKKHDQYADALDMGIVTVSEYLDKVVFDVPRTFSKAEFYEFMKTQSVPDLATIAIARAISLQKKYAMATMNNESIELNIYRIEKFGLGEIFPAFLSSCYLGLKKPHLEFYKRALHITNKRPEDVLFIDDREENLKEPKNLGMAVIHFQSAVQLDQELRETFGIDVGARR